MNHKLDKIKLDINPLLTYDNDYAFSIAIITVTRCADVAKAPQEAKDAIESEMKKRTVSVYDADQFYLIP